MTPLAAFVLGAFAGLLTFAVVFLPGAARRGVIQGAKHMLDVIEGQQAYCYKALANEPNSEIILHTADAFAAGANAAFRELVKEAQ